MRDLLPEWNDLWRRVPGATPFQSPAWLLAWWRHFATGAPKILTSRSTGTLVGALPLYVRVEGTACKLLPIGIGLSDYLDALVDPQYPDAARELFEAIAGIAGWHECHLPDLPPGAKLATAPCPAGLRETGGPTVPCPVLPLPPTADGLGRVVPRKTLRDLRQAAARAAPLGRVEIACADAASLGDTMGELFRLHEKRWQSRGEGGVLRRPGGARLSPRRGRSPGRCRAAAALPPRGRRRDDRGLLRACA